VGDDLEKSLMLPVGEWHNRFLQQARWTEEIRRSCYTRLNFKTTERVLEVGCGSGAITADLHRFSPGNIYGLDIRQDFLGQAHKIDPATRFIQGDSLCLPFKNNSIDAVVCHFLLLWVKQADQALAEMRRVTRRGGCVVALAEPDYGGRIDYPDQLFELGRLQGAALQAQGADINTGRKLAALFHQAGFKNVQVGLLGGLWKEPPSTGTWQSEWTMLAADLKDTLSTRELEKLRSLDAAAWQNGERILFVPTFYAWGWV
jgi:ubiquinone/menaquinone biosynthesis C-methylase UbiE